MDSVVKLMAADESSSAPPSAQERSETADLRGVPVYATYYGFDEAPFDLRPNPKFLFQNDRQREALSNIRYGLSTAKGFILILGDAGTGKTTLLRTALEDLRDTPSRFVLLSNPTLGREEFYEHLAREFGMSDEARSSKTRFLVELQTEVESRAAAGGITGLIVDEAQSLPYDLLEEIRLLGNMETPTKKLLNIVLSGQPELAARLNDPNLRQLKQRIALRCTLMPLSLSETSSYIAGRIRIAGGSPNAVFTREAVIAIHEASAGIPRMINVLCDNALITGFAALATPITAAIAEDVCRDFDVSAEAVEQVAPAANQGTAGTQSSAPGRCPSSTRKCRPTADVWKRRTVAQAPIQVLLDYGDNPYCAHARSLPCPGPGPGAGALGRSDCRRY